MIDAEPDLYKEIINSHKESSSHDIEESLWTKHHTIIVIEQRNHITFMKNKIIITK